MAIIPQRQLFSWKEIENLGDLQRLQLALKYLPDERLMRLLESHRGKGRNDYPIRAVWNSILAGVIFQHNSIESLRRELLRWRNLSVTLYLSPDAQPDARAAAFRYLLLVTPVAARQVRFVLQPELG